jgi:hypothetical protein
MKIKNGRTNHYPSTDFHTIIVYYVGLIVISCCVIALSLSAFRASHFLTCSLNLNNVSQTMCRG